MWCCMVKPDHSEVDLASPITPHVHLTVFIRQSKEGEVWAKGILEILEIKIISQQGNLLHYGMISSGSSTTWGT